MKTDVLILGFGYLGIRAARLWLAQGLHVAALTRRTERLAALQAEGIDAIQGDVLDPASLRELPTAGVILYAVGHDRNGAIPMETLTEQGIRHVVDVWRNRPMSPPCHCVYISSTSVYGQTDGSWVDESAPCEPFTSAGPSILAAERQLQEAAVRIPGLTATILRFAGIYGPGRLFREQVLRRGEPLATDPDGWLNLIHVDDGAQIVYQAAEHARRQGVFNVADGAPVRRGDFYRFLAGQLNAPAPCFKSPGPSSVPGAETANRRIAVHRLWQAFSPRLRHPNFQAGIVASVTNKP